jgi:hypothetical protein
VRIFVGNGGGNGELLPLFFAALLFGCSPISPAYRVFDGADSLEFVVDVSEIPRFEAPPEGAAFRGIRPEQWNAIAKIGDPARCIRRVKRLQDLDLRGANRIRVKDHNKNPTLINESLERNDITILEGGRYLLTEPIVVSGDRFLIGEECKAVILDASHSRHGVRIENGNVANLSIVNAQELGIIMERDSLLYRVTVDGTGLNSDTTRGSGISISGWHAHNPRNNCIVSVDSARNYNRSGLSGTTRNGGNADGFEVKFGASDVTFIDAHAYENSDDGYDFWKGGAGSDDAGVAIRVFYSSASRNGRHPTRPNGDGNGFKLGSKNSYESTHPSGNDRGKRLVYGSAACFNKARGFDRNGSPTEIIAVNLKALGNAEPFSEDLIRYYVGRDGHALTCSTPLERR